MTPTCYVCRRGVHGEADAHAVQQASRHHGGQAGGKGHNERAGTCGRRTAMRHLCRLPTVFHRGTARAAGATQEELHPQRAASGAAAASLPPHLHHTRQRPPAARAAAPACRRTAAQRLRADRNRRWMNPFQRSTQWQQGSVPVVRQTATAACNSCSCCGAHARGARAARRYTAAPQQQPT
jgi:hypothetical protein